MVLASNFISEDTGLFSTAASGFLPRVAVVPLEEYSGDAEVLVSEGDSVKEGEVIAKSADRYIHSSVPGRVLRIGGTQYSNGKYGLCAEILLCGSFSYLGKKQPHQEWTNFESATVAFLLKEAGVVDTFGKARSVYGIIKNLQGSFPRIMAVRLFDDDPSRVLERFLAQQYIENIVEGAAVLAKAAKADAVVFACPKSERIETERFSGLFGSSVKVFSVGLDTRKYPAGLMHDIVSAAKKADADGVCAHFGRKDFFVDSRTALDAYRAVALGMPVMSAFVHVTGRCLNSAAIMNVKIGTPLKNIVEQCGGFKHKPAKIIINGIMSGISVSSLDIPVDQTVKSVEFVPAGGVLPPHAELCIRCGSCRSICPVGLWPGNLYRIARLDAPADSVLSNKAVSDSAVLCTECGLCNSVCPSRLPLSQTIVILKEKKHEES